ncbi:hypothetical protein J7L48_06330, partial [bacterium]|nr:hypothetical protein [bacterium]
MLSKKFIALLIVMIKNELRGQFIRFGKSASYTQILIYLSYIIWGFFLSTSYFLKPILQFPLGVYSIYSIQFILIFFILVMELNRSLLYPDDALTLLKLPIGRDNILLAKFLSIIFFALIFSGLFGFTWIFWGFIKGFSFGIIHFFLLLFFTLLNSIIVVVLALGFYLLVYSLVGVKNIKKFFVFFTLLITVVLYYFIFFVNSPGNFGQMKEVKYIPSFYFEIIYREFLNRHFLNGTLYFLLLLLFVITMAFIIVKLFSKFYLEFLKNVTIQSSITVKTKKINSNPMKILL